MNNEVIITKINTSITHIKKKKKLNLFVKFSLTNNKKKNYLHVINQQNPDANCLILSKNISNILNELARS